MHVERAVLGQDAVGFFQSWGKKSQVVVESVGVCPRTNGGGLVSPPLKPRAVSLRGSDGSLLGERLPLARIEWRVDVDEVHTPGGQRFEHGKALTEVDPMLHPAFAFCRLPIEGEAAAPRIRRFET